MLRMLADFKPSPSTFAHKSLKKRENRRE